MKIVSLSLVLLGMISRCHGLTCRICEDTDGYDGHGLTADHCYDDVASVTNVSSCSPDTPSEQFYCQTIFTINDGVTFAVKRGCIGTTADEDQHSDTVPTSDKCVTTFNPVTPTTTQTLCYLHCTTDDCNTQTAASLKKCPSDCNIGTGAGICNYLTGLCECSGTNSGDDCGTVVSTSSGALRQCVQCSSETDNSCSSSSTFTDCPDNEAYCSSTTTTIFDTSGTIIHTVVNKGCTASFQAVDECILNSVTTDPPINSVGYTEFNCYSTCNTDGCNTNSADGVINGNEAILLECVVCNDATGSGSCNPDTTLTRQLCPSGTTHCKSTVTYAISEKRDRLYSDEEPIFQLLSVVRECATAAVNTECTESDITTDSLKKVTCTETCEEDGCNIGWPARPDCIDCSSTTGTGAADYDKDGYDHCLENPPMSTTCPMPYHAYCYVQEIGLEKGSLESVKGYPRRVTRGCSYINYGTGCSTSRPHDIDIETCNRTCSTDGCNAGSGSSTLIATLLTFVLPATFGWLTQRYF